MFFLKHLFFVCFMLTFAPIGMSAMQWVENEDSNLFYQPVVQRGCWSQLKPINFDLSTKKSTKKEIALGHVVFKTSTFANGVSIKIRQFKARDAEIGTSGLHAAYVLNFFLCNKVKLPNGSGLFEKFKEYAMQVNKTVFDLDEKQVLGLISEDRRKDVTIIDDRALEMIKGRVCDYSGLAELFGKKKTVSVWAFPVFFDKKRKNWDLASL